MQSLSRSLQFFFDVSGCIESVSLRWFYVIYVGYSSSDGFIGPPCLMAHLREVEARSESTVSALNGSNVMRAAALPLMWWPHKWVNISLSVMGLLISLLLTSSHIHIYEWYGSRLADIPLPWYGFVPTDSKGLPCSYTSVLTPR